MSVTITTYSHKSIKYNSHLYRSMIASYQNIADANASYYARSSSGILFGLQSEYVALLRTTY